MYSREDVVKTLLAKKGVDPFATGGVRKKSFFLITYSSCEVFARPAQIAYRL